MTYAEAVAIEGVYETSTGIYLSFWGRIREVAPDGTFGPFVDPGTDVRFTPVPSSDWDIAR